VPLEAPAGSCVVYDARLWHGTGINDGSVLNPDTGLPWRLGIFSLYCAPWARPQENMALGVLPEVLDELSDRQKILIGLRPWHAYGRVGTAGFPKVMDGITSAWESAGTIIKRGDAIVNGGVGELRRERR